MNKWLFDGVALDTFAYNIQAVTAGLGLPARRGENIVIPYRDGSRYIQKPLAERTISLSMWISDKNTDGAAASNRKLKLAENQDALMMLFGQEGLHTLTRVMPDGTKRRIECEARNPIDFIKQSPFSVAFSVDLVCPDPYWYGDITTFKLTLDSTINSGQLTNPGTGTSRKAIITVTGATNNLQIKNASINQYLWVKYNGLAEAGDELIIDSERYTAKLNGQNQSGLITHSGDPAFMVLQPGINEIEVTGDTAANATLEIEFYAPYL